MNDIAPILINGFEALYEVSDGLTLLSVSRILSCSHFSLYSYDEFSSGDSSEDFLSMLVASISAFFA